MLLELRIKNFAIIDALHLEFIPGFVVLTGETGAGKSIIMGALDMLLGFRVDMSTLRKGSETSTWDYWTDSLAQPVCLMPIPRYMIN
jgi:DNA repair protein RecN (Recombination protein N)